MLHLNPVYLLLLLDRSFLAWGLTTKVSLVKLEVKVPIPRLASRLSPCYTIFILRVEISHYILRGAILLVLLMLKWWLVRHWLLYLRWLHRHRLVPVVGHLILLLWLRLLEIHQILIVVVNIVHLNLI